MGDLVAGRYRLLQELGSGAMGSVWRAFDERLGRRVAVKRVLPVDEAGDLRDRVLREGRIAARLHHPHAVAVFDVVEDDGLPVLVMEYLSADSLAEVLAERGTLPPTEVAEIGAQVADALAAAHEAGIVHRDVKPGNILLSDEGAKLTDFGIAHASGDATITATGMVAGTPAYLPPETVHGRRPLPASDVYSLGATLYTAVEGTPPFGRDVENPYAVLYRIAAGELRPPRQAGPLTPVLTAMLAHDAVDRPTAEEAAAQLRAIAQGRELPVTLSLPRPRRRLLAAIAGALAVFAMIAYLVLDKSSPATPPVVAATAAPSAMDQEKAVADYYALLPGKAGEAWGRLTAQRRAQGEDAFLAYWSQVATVTASAPHADGSAVTVVLDLKLKDGTIAHEVHRIALDRLLIGTDTVLTSERTAPAAPPPPPVTVTQEVRAAAPAPVPAPAPAEVAQEADHGKKLGHDKGKH